MKTLVAILALLLAVPTYATEIKVKTSERAVVIKTDCYHNITSDTKITMRPLSSKLRVNAKVRVYIDGEPTVCKIKKVTTAQKS